MFVECENCLNSTANPTVSIGEDGLCRMCSLYNKYFDPSLLKSELDSLEPFRKGGGKYDVMAGISGGKDSSAMLYTIKNMGFRPLAFTFDIGYYPKHEFSRAAEVAKRLDIDHEIIKINKYLTRNDITAYQKTAELYAGRDSEKLREKFRRIYMHERAYYKANSRSTMPVVRTCQLCRRAVIKAYYSEALKRGIKVVVLAMNEWVGLSQNKDGKYIFSGIRRLKPFANKPEVYIVHLPFLLRRNLEQTEEILKKINWKHPNGENLVESNSNSCLFAKAAEAKFVRLMGFHPDTPRLSREITAGFLQKEIARKALEKSHKSNKSVMAVLREAQILNMN